MRVYPIKNQNKIDKIKRYLYKTDMRTYVLFILGINTGLRISDIVPLQVKNTCNIVHKKIYVKTHIEIKEEKTNKYHKIFINDSLNDALKEYCENKKVNDYLFPSQKGKHICEDYAYVLLKKAFKKCRVRQNTGTHTMRKTHGYFINEKYDIETAQKQLNHTNQRDTLRYIGLEQEELDTAVGGLNL